MTFFSFQDCSAPFTLTFHTDAISDALNAIPGTPASRGTLRKSFYFYFYFSPLSPVFKATGWKFTKLLKIFVTFRCFYKAIIHRK